MTDFNRLTKTRRPSAQHDVGVYDMEQQRQRSSCVRTNAQTRVQSIMDDVYGLEEPITRSRRASSTQNGETRMRRDTDEPYQHQYRSTTEPNPTRRSAATQAQPTQVQPKALRPKMYMPQPEQQLNRRQRHLSINPTVWFGGGMCMLLLLLIVAVNAMCWIENTEDTTYFTQTSHHDAVVVNTQSGQEEVKGFIDARGHLDALIIPFSNPTKARIYPGPALDNPHDAMVSASVKGGQVEIDAVYPYHVFFFSVERSESGARWTPGIQAQSQDHK